MQTDLNQRERRKYGEQLRNISKSALECADALEAEDDTKAMVSWVMMLLVGQSINVDLGPIFKQSVEVAEATKELDT